MLELHDIAHKEVSISPFPRICNKIN